MRGRLRPGTGKAALCVLVIGVLMPLWGHAAAAPAGLQGAIPRPWDAAVTEASLRFTLPESWIHAVIRVESGGDPGARSSKGAMGLMQLMPDTWKAISMQEKLGQNPFDLRANVLAGAAYLRAMVDRYGNLSIALAAYNAGPGRIDDWRRSGHALPAETLAYVARLSLRLGLGGSVSTASMAPQTAPRPLDWRASSLFGLARTQQQIAAAMQRRELPPPVIPDTDTLRVPGIFVAMSQRSAP